MKRWSVGRYSFLRSVPTARLPGALWAEVSAMLRTALAATSGSTGGISFFFFLFYAESIRSPRYSCTGPRTGEADRANPPRRVQMRLLNGNSQQLKVIIKSIMNPQPANGDEIIQPT
ncbi:unnamed protein product [Linum trigynum]|uniref:Uncharacterized protein n=1 Tax=Linum trigynum TaxID=586398 RepID=A0AAV2GAF1_9ROSI